VPSERSLVEEEFGEANASAKSVSSEKAELISISDLSFSYGGTQVPVLSNVNLSVRRGSIMLLVGPSGGGKTTFALALNGLIPHATGGSFRGRVLIDGVDTQSSTTASLATNIGVVFQDPESQLCALFVEDEIAFGPENLKVASQEIRRIVTELLGGIGLSDAGCSSVYELSGGQKQKVNIASVLAMRPKIMILDMPTANLDPSGRADVLGLMKQLVLSQGTSCIIAENNLDELAELVDRVVVIDHGKIVADGVPEAIFCKENSDLLLQAGVRLPQIVDASLRLQGMGCDVSLSFRPEDLASQLLPLFKSKKLEMRSTQERATKPTTSVDPIVEVHDLTFAYKKNEPVLKNLSFGVDRDGLTAIIGNNGSGKTTLAKIMMGLLHHSKGQVMVCGLDTALHTVEDLAERTAYVFQYPEHQFVSQQQTVYDEVAFNLRMEGRPENRVSERVSELIEQFGLIGKEQTSPYTLSGGEMRALSVACMLSTEPQLLILDEPTYGQDQRRIDALMQRLMQYREQGTSIVIITHDMGLVAEYATSVLVLSDGQLLYQGSAAHLFEEENLLLAKAGLRPPPVCALTGLLRSDGVGLPAGLTTVTSFLRELEVPSAVQGGE